MKKILPIFVILIFVFYGCASTDGFNKLDSYDWGSVAGDVLKEIGVEQIKDINIRDNDNHTIIYDVTITTESGKLSLYPTKDSNKEWTILWVNNNDFASEVPFGAKYYVCDNLKYNDEGMLVEDIYDYKTYAIIEAKDEAAAEIERTRRHDVAESVLEADNAREKEEKQQAVMLFHEIRVAYKNNELSADDTYKGNRYIIIGQFDGVSEDGVFNTLLNEINVTVKIMDGNTPCYVFCSFDADTWREKLAELNKGDEMIIEGECYSWGSWDDCELKN